MQDLINRSSVVRMCWGLDRRLVTAILHICTMASTSGIATPAIKSKSEVTLYEQHDVQTHKFLRSLFTLFDQDDHAWIGENAALGKKDLSVQDLKAGLRLVADHEAFPEAPPDVTLAPCSRLDNLFVKRPRVHLLFDRYTAALVPAPSSYLQGPLGELTMTTMFRSKITT